MTPDNSHINDPQRSSPSRTRRARKRWRKLVQSTAQAMGEAGGWGPGSDIRPGDFLLVSRAIREGWDIPPNVLAAIFRRAAEIAADDSLADDGTRENARLLLAVGRAVPAILDDGVRRLLAVHSTNDRAADPPNDDSKCIGNHTNGNEALT